MSDYVDIRQQMPLTPTLVIGLGGTGVNVVRRVKGLLGRYFADRNLGDIPPIFRFLAVDSVPLTNAHGVTEIERTEHVYLGQVDGSLVVSNLRYHPEIESWWDQQRNAPGKLDNGCGQMRDCGRLVLFYHYSDFIARLEDQINAILYQSTVFETEYRGFVIRPRQLRICVVGSIAGGTGSGTFLDATYNVHDIIHRRSGVTASVEGYLVLPDVFLPHLPSLAMQESVQANGYAALTELEFLNRNPDRAPEFFRKYPGGTTIDVKRRPFDHTFLVGIRDQQGYGFSSADQVYESIAQAIYLESVYLDQAMTENTANIFADSDIGGDVGNTGIGRYYSSFSVSSVSVRRDIALQYAEHRLALDTLHDLLRETDTADQDVTPPPDELKSDALVSGIADRLARSHPRPDLFDRHEAESKPLLETLDRNDRALHSWFDENLQPLQEAARKKQRELREYVDKQAWTVALDRGIEAVFPYLRGWLRQLQQVSEDFRDRASRLDGRADELHRTYEHDRTELDELALGPGLRVLMFDGTAKRRHRREQLFDDARKMLADQYTTRLEREIVRHIHNTVIHSLLGDTVEDEFGSITRLIKQWEGVREVFQGVLGDLEGGLESLVQLATRLERTESRYAIAHELSLSRPELEELYGEIQTTFGRTDYLRWLGDAVEATDPDGLDSPQHLRETVRNLMIRHAEEVCLPVFAGTSTDAAILQAHKAVQMVIGRTLGTYVGQAAVLNELFNYNVPFWNFSAVTNMANVLERTNLVAAESRQPEGWHSTDPEDVVALGRGQDQLEHGVETDRIVETGDPSLLGVYRASYGLPLFLLNEIPALREHYLRRRALNRDVQGKRQGLSLHLTAGWNNEPPVDLAVDDQGKALITGTTD